MTWIDPTSGPQSGPDSEALRRAFEALTHSASIIHVRADAPVGGGALVAQNQGVAPWTRWFDTTNKLDKIWSPTHDKWITLTPVSARDDGAGTTASLTYTNLTGTGVGPAVTVETGTTAIVRLTSEASNNTAGNGCAMSVAITGASSIVAADTYWQLVIATEPFRNTAEYLFTNLVPGSNIFTAKYRVGGGTGTWSKRLISVQAVPT